LASACSARSLALSRSCPSGTGITQQSCTLPIRGCVRKASAFDVRSADPGRVEARARAAAQLDQTMRRGIKRPQSFHGESTFHDPSCSTARCDCRR
jgi:hypothetical protein